MFESANSATRSTRKLEERVPLLREAAGLQLDCCNRGSSGIILMPGGLRRQGETVNILNEWMDRATSKPMPCAS